MGEKFTQRSLLTEEEKQSIRNVAFKLALGGMSKIKKEVVIGENEHREKFTPEQVKQFKMTGEIPATDEERLKIMTEDYEIPEEKAKELLEKFKLMRQ